MVLKANGKHWSANAVTKWRRAKKIDELTKESDDKSIVGMLQGWNDAIKISSMTINTNFIHLPTVADIGNALMGAF